MQTNNGYQSMPISLRRSAAIFFAGGPRGILGKVLLPMVLLAAGCAGQQSGSQRYQLSSWGTDSGRHGCYIFDAATGKIRLYEGHSLVSTFSLSDATVKQPEQFITSLTPRDAVYRALAALHDKLGTDLCVSPTTPFDPKFVDADRFSASGLVSTAVGKQFEIECEWLADGKTQVTFNSQLPDAQTALFAKIARDAIESSAQP